MSSRRTHPRARTRTHTIVTPRASLVVARSFLPRARTRTPTGARGAFFLLLTECFFSGEKMLVCMDVGSRPSTDH